MVMNMYSIYDVKADLYMLPFFMATDGQAKRAFGDLANDVNTAVGKHPEDYVLCRVGTWDDMTAVVMSENDARLGVASEYVNRKAPLVEVVKGKEVA